MSVQRKTGVTEAAFAKLTTASERHRQCTQHQRRVHSREMHCILRATCQWHKSREAVVGWHATAADGVCLTEVQLATHGRLGRYACAQQSPAQRDDWRQRANEGEVTRRRIMFNRCMQSASTHTHTQASAR